MDPQLSGFALGLLLGAAKLGVLGTIGFGLAWWFTRRKLRRLESTGPDPAQLAERLAVLERGFDYFAAQMDRLVDSQTTLARQLGEQNISSGESRALPLEPPRDRLQRPGPITPR